MQTPPITMLVAAAAQALTERIDDVNRLNVFPVPDGDTGTNMSLTMDAVIAELQTLPADADTRTICHTITHASLMGARGNSGVILSQILRGLCDAVAEAERFDAASVATALARSTEVAFQAVRKPVEGTMLTVLKDSAARAKRAAREGVELDSLLEQVVSEAFDSVRRTPELLPVLKENGVVDAGGYGLAILAEGLFSAYQGRGLQIVDLAGTGPDLLAVVPVDDWDDNEYLYCTEFLLFGEEIDREEVLDFVITLGGSELVVGDAGEFKIHVHTNDPAAVLSRMTTMGEVAEVHINNMRRQTAERSAGLREAAERKPFGLVTVAVGEGLKEILTSLGVDVIINGGQTMNPSTAELLSAAEELNADQVIILPNNKNIHMAAQKAVEHASRPMGMVPTRSVPEAFTALLALDPDVSLEENVAEMTEAAASVRTGEVTTAIKDSSGKVGPIRAGQVIGIFDDEIEVVGSDVIDVTVRLAALMLDDAETITILAGLDLTDESLEQLTTTLAAARPDIEIETHRGGQPLYPVILSAE
jgi:hypothetical protein